MNDDNDIPVEHYMICWTPLQVESEAAGEIIVVRHGTHVSKRYLFSTGVCFTEQTSMAHEQQVLQMFLDFHTIVVRDGIDPQDAHREFLKIREYRRRISPDISGSE
jgi:hypothetical protein